MNIQSKILFLFYVFFLWTACVVHGQEPFFDVKLWEQGLPNTNGTDTGGYDLGEKNYKPIMRVFLPPQEKATGRAIVCFPGGGYAQTSLDHYGEDWAPFYNNLGIALVVLHYRVPKGKPEVSISDAMEAYRQTKLHAKAWRINPTDIGIQGISAGGHLASTLTAHHQDSIGAAFQILIYPVISFKSPYAHSGSRDNFIGAPPLLKKDATVQESTDYERRKVTYEVLKNKYSNENHISAHTPRTFIASSDNDKLTMNSILYYTALHEKKIPAVLHTYPSGGHGWHINVKNNRFLFADLVERELMAWLQSF